jgi:hypothetical protein
MQRSVPVWSEVFVAASFVASAPEDPDPVMYTRTPQLVVACAMSDVAESVDALALLPGTTSAATPAAIAATPRKIR